MDKMAAAHPTTKIINPTDTRTAKDHQGIVDVPKKTLEATIENKLGSDAHTNLRSDQAIFCLSVGQATGRARC